MTRRHHSAHGPLRRYLLHAVLKAMPHNKPVFSRELVDDVQELSGVELTPQRIGKYMSVLEERGEVYRLGPERRTRWMKMRRVR